MTFRDAIEAARKAMDDAKGVQFSIVGRGGIFIGNINELASDPTLVPGGFQEGKTVTIFASRSQFGTIPPKEGQLIEYAEGRVKITSVNRDPSKYVLTCSGVNQ